MNSLLSWLGMPERLRLIGILIAALGGGLGTGYYLSRPIVAQSAKSDAPIEWNQVQTIPTRAADAEDKEWQERSDALDAPATNAVLPRRGSQEEQ